MSSGLAATIVGVLLAAFLAGIGFLIRAVLNNITALRKLVQTNIDTLTNKVDTQDTRITVLETVVDGMRDNGRRITTLGETQAVLASEMQNHQQWHREQVLLQRERDRRGQ